MNFENLITTSANGIFTITINRPDKLNALNKNTIREIGEAVQAASRNSDIRVIIITGAGNKAFVAGADISEFNNFTEQEAVGLSQHGHHVFNSIENCSKPVIAAVNGFALGGGCELAMACHLRVASSNARFGQPEVKLGLIPGYGGTQRLAMLIGKTRALEMLMTADVMGADEAHARGLVNYVTAPEELMPKCIELAGKIIKQAPLAVSGVITSVNDLYNNQKNGYQTEITEFGKCFATSDFKEGATAFLEKRAANFKGN